MQQQSDKEPHTISAGDSGDDIVEEVEQEIQRSRAPWYHVFKHMRILVDIYLLLFVLFTLLAWFVRSNPIIPVDVAITREFQENKSPWLLFLMVAVSFPGNSPLFSILLVVLAMIVFWTIRLPLEALLVGIHSLVSYLLNILLKWLINRPRPTANLIDIIQEAPGKSYPSGHVMAYIAFWGLLFSLNLILLKRDRWWHYVLLVVLALPVVLVGPSRIYLGDHWASDVLGGYMLGSLLLGISLWIYLRLKKRGVLS